MQRLSLAQQIAQLEDVAPLDFDPEDIQVTGIGPNSDLSIVADDNAARAHYFDVGPSSLRKPHESLSDPKYDGTKTSRKLMLDGTDNESDSTAKDTESGSHIPGVPSEMGMRTVTGVKGKAGIHTITDAEHSSTPNENNDLSSNLCNIREQDRKKGKAISRQTALWDSLLDARIRLQKSVMAGNCLPLPSHMTTDERVHTPIVKMLEEALSLSNEIFEFQECLLSANESIQPLPRKRRRSTENDYAVSDYVEELRAASHATSELECVYHPHLVRTLNKWSSKIQAVAPSVLLPSNRNAFSKATQHIRSAPQLVDETLAEYSKALARTRIYRGKKSRLGVNVTGEDGTGEKEDSEIFDDTDFYHLLLRDIIDARGKTGGSDDRIRVQKEKGAKGKVDTKASKGRKLRYEVHEKIQNFMVPVLTQAGWHEEQIDELFASLLGKGFEGAIKEAWENTGDGSLQQEVNATLQGGFRVFG